MMSNETPDSETVLAQTDGEQFATEKLTVEGQPRLGNIVEVEYDSRAGGSHSTTSNTTLAGELMYVEVGREVTGDERGDWNGKVTLIVRDAERSRAVAVPLDVDNVGGSTAKSLAASKTKRGRRLGRVERVTFTDREKNAHAPAIKALRSVRSGDTLNVNGTEYGVEQVYGSGPDSRPSGFTAHLTRPEGGRWTLRAKAAYDSPRFIGPDCEYGEFLNLDVSSIQPGRYTERWTDDVHGRENTENTNDAFPAPHGHREGERITVTLATEDADETVTGTVTNVRYFTREEHVGLGSPEERDPETNVELDDGRELTLNNDTRHTSLAFRDDDRHDTMAYRAMVKTPREDGDNEYTHPLAVDIRGEGEDRDTDDDSDGEPEDAATDGGEPLAADGGEEQGDGAEEIVDRSELETGDHIRVEYVSHESGNDHERTGTVTEVVENDSGDFQQAEFETEMGDKYAISEIGICTTGESWRPFGRELTIYRRPYSGRSNRRDSGYVSPDERERNSEALAHREQRNRNRVVDGRDPRTDGGVDVDALASDVAGALRESEVSMNRVSIITSRGDVSVKTNGYVERDTWTELRDDITTALEREGFEYVAKEQWAFVDVTGRTDGEGGELRADGGTADAEHDADGRAPEDRHGSVKRKLINSPIVRGARTLGDDNQYLAIFRDKEATEDELDEYHLVLDLSNYVQMNPDVVDDPGDMVGGDDITMDVWMLKSDRDGGNGGDSSE